MDSPREIMMLRHHMYVQSVADIACRFGVQAFLVGGSLRDALLGRGGHDLDFVLDGALQDLPEAMAQLNHGRFFWLDHQRRQSRVVFGHGSAGYTLDFAPLRGQTIHGDLVLRDFTINALALPLNGDSSCLIDPLGGLHDLAASRIRACGPLSFLDDPLRLLRAVRFAATLGFAIEPSTWSDLYTHCSLIKSVARERIRDEFFQILTASGSADSLEQLNNSGLLGHVLGAVQLQGGVAQSLGRVMAVEQLVDSGPAMLGGCWAAVADRLSSSVEGGISILSLVKLAAFVAEGSPEDCVLVAQRLRLGRKALRELQILCNLCRYSATVRELTAGDRVLFRFFHDNQPAGLELLVLPLLGKMITVASARQMAVYFLERYCPDEGDLLLDGAEVMDLLDIGPGRLLGATLDQLRRAESCGVVATVQEAREYLLKNRLTKMKPMG